ncbi:MAG: RsiV family protein [Minisyncoccia bacterium]
MQVRPWEILVGLLTLVAVGVGLWFVLMRPLPEGSGPHATSTDTGSEEREIYTESGEYYEITAEYPTQIPLAHSASATMEAAAVSTMHAFVLSEAERFRENNVENLTAEDIALQNLGGERTYLLHIKYTMYESPETVSYVYSLFADTLGAHPNGYYRTYTFYKKTGEGLALDSLFSPSANHLEVLSMLSREKLGETLGEGNFDREYLEAGTSPDADNFQNFYLEGSSLILLFPPYQVGPWALGIQEARISREELGNTLREEYR